jgi:Protein of unknown function (DUF3048) N-terminal domain/Protein of unknown function (DUF3048) C-terminal domain
MSVTPMLLEDLLVSVGRLTRSRRVLVLSGAAVVAAACGHSSHKATPAVTTPPPSAAPSASVAAATSAAAVPSATSAAPTTTKAPAKPRPGPAADPLTGSSKKPTGPVVVIKVDNSVSARPLQKGISRAAIVYQELVEGGDTRYMAIFDNPMHFEVGPVRSARPTDLKILEPFGKVVLGFSGANSGVLAQVHAANVVPVSQEQNGNAYVTEGRRPVAYNFYTWPDTLVAKAPKKPDPGVPDIGLRFGVENVGRPFTDLHVSYGRGGAGTEAIYNPKTKKYRMIQGTTPMNLDDGTTVTPTNLIVEFVDVQKGQYVDVDGNNSPDSIVVGKGEALILHDGKLWHKRWSRPTLSSPTRYIDDKGNDVKLSPGQTWIMIVARDHGTATGS